MDALSVLLAKWMGLYLLITGTVVLLRKEHVREAAGEFVSSPGMLLLGGAFTLIIGLGVVLGHPVYSADWRIIITLFGWLMVGAGIFRMWGPPGIKRVFHLIDGPLWWLLIVGTFMLGAYLVGIGFS